MEKQLHKDYVTEQKLKLLDIANRVLENETKMILECRELCKVNEAIDGEYRDKLKSVYHVVDEAEGIPLLSEERVPCAHEYLGKIDERVQKIINLNLDDVKSECLQLKRHLEKQLGSFPDTHSKK